METVETTSTVLFIVAAASIFGWMLTATRTTEMIAQWILTFADAPWKFLLLANALMLFVGCFLEPTAAITILVPILLPIVQQLGIDPVHFGLVMLLNLMIGLLHPPKRLLLLVLAWRATLSDRNVSSQPEQKEARRAAQEKKRPPDASAKRARNGATRRARAAAITQAPPRGTGEVSIPGGRLA